MKPKYNNKDCPICKGSKTILIKEKNGEEFISFCNCWIEYQKELALYYRYRDAGISEKDIETFNLELPISEVFDINNVLLKKISLITEKFYSRFYNVSLNFYGETALDASLYILKKLIFQNLNFKGVFLEAGDLVNQIDIFYKQEGLKEVTENKELIYQQYLDVDLLIIWIKPTCVFTDRRLELFHTFCSKRTNNRKAIIYITEKKVDKVYVDDYIYFDGVSSKHIFNIENLWGD